MRIEELLKMIAINRDRIELANGLKAAVEEIKKLQERVAALERWREVQIETGVDDYLW